MLSTRGEMVALPLPSTACQPLWFEDQHASAVHAEPATVREIRERLVDRLPRRADEVRQLLLCQVVRDPQALVLMPAESLRQLQQLFGETAGPVGRDQRGEGVVGQPQAAG